MTGHEARRVVPKRRLCTDVICALLAATTAAAATQADNSTTQPAQSDLDFLLSQSRGAPATQPGNQADAPASQPASPFDSTRPEGARQGMMLLSNGEKIHGLLAHTARKPMRIWVEEQKAYRDVPFALVQSIDAQVVWERQEKEWHFKESGSDIKEYSGKTYPARDTEYQITLKNGKTITGAVVEPLYLVMRDGSVTYALHKRDKGDLGQSLDELVYVKHVEFDDAPATTQP